MKTSIRVMILVGVMLVALVLGITGTINIINGSVNDPLRSSDTLIGVLVTKDYLDLNDGIRPADDGEVTESINAKDTARYCATIVETPFTNKETGETGVVKEYAFKGIEGMSFFAPKMMSPSGSYRSQIVDAPFADVHTHYHVTDEGESISLKGTIYMTSGVNFDALYFNPVYQSASGEVYVVSGDAIVGFDGFIPGASMSTTLNEKRTKTVGDSDVTDSTEIEVTVSYKDIPTGVVILQFDGSDQLLSRDEYIPGMMPETLTMRPEAQYAVVETITVSEDPLSAVTREIYQRRDDALEVFLCREDGLCDKQSYDIDWID